MKRSFTNFKWLLCTSLMIAATGFKASAQMRITEFMYDGTNAEFVEFTNIGTTAVDMTNWFYTDNNRVLTGTTGRILLSAFGTVGPGESVLLTEASAATFRTAWNLCGNIKIIGGSTVNLGRSDEVNLYNGSTTPVLIDRLTYNDQGTGIVKGPRTQLFSAYTTAANLGANNASLWVLSAVGDSEGSVASTGTATDKGSPGRTNVNATTQAYVACPPPSTLTLTLNTTATTSYLSYGATANATGISFSGVINDPLDPGATIGLTLDVKDNNTAIATSDYTLTGASNNTAVVPNANIQISKSNGSAVVKVVPAGVGYAALTLTLAKGANTQTFTINYAASASAPTPANTVFHTGFSDGSAAVAIDNDFMVVADDEKNILNVYPRRQSGLPVKAFDYSAIADLSLTDVSGGVPREIDIEAVAKSLSAGTPNRSYWLGSLSNQSSAGSAFNDRPNRNRIFAVDVTNTGANTAFSYVGCYRNLKTSILNWGTANNLGLSASATAGKDPKLVDGFNIEGMSFAPDGTTMYIGFRAPLLPTTNRINALIAPVQNFESWFGNGTTTAPTIGSPILLNLAGRGIRDIGRFGTNLYLILAGDYDDAGALSPVIYRWNGNASDAPVAGAGFNVASLNPEGVLPVFNNGVMNTNQLQIISDNGAVSFYNDNVDAKDLATNNFKKFRSDFVTSATPLPVIFEDFQAKAGSMGQVVVTWKNAISSNTDRFEVERSADGKAFESVTMVFASAETTQYSYTDNICCVPAVFYRIKEIMKDGSLYYTNIRMVRLESDDISSIAIGYKNEQRLLSITSSTATTKEVRISNLSGEIVLMTVAAERQQTISLADLPLGMFIVQVKDGSTTKTAKIMRY